MLRVSAILHDRILCRYFTQLYAKKIVANNIAFVRRKYAEVTKGYEFKTKYTLLDLLFLEANCKR